MSPNPLVSIRQLKLEALTARGTAHILRGIDLDIGKGRIVGVVGESGSGKSSLAACLLRLLPANVSRLDGEIGLGFDQRGQSEAKNWVIIDDEQRLPRSVRFSSRRVHRPDLRARRMAGATEMRRRPPFRPRAGASR